MMSRPTLTAALLASLALLGGVKAVDACTGIRITTRDGAVIYGRTLEFGILLDSKIVVIPRGKEYVGTAPGGRAGARWTTTLGVVGANARDYEGVVDGINEKGLVVGAFYQPGFAKYVEPAAEDAGRTLAPWELPTWLLSQFATVAEAKKALGDIRVVGSRFADLDLVPPLHYVVHDPSGECLVVEFTEGAMKLYDNPLGVITNSPTFDWHLINLRNYLNLSATDVPRVDLGVLKLGQLGQGSGLLGLPGDYTPPSRFVRATVLSQSAKPAATAKDGINLASHILNSFDIFPGLVRAKGPEGEMLELTQWTSFADLKNKCYYFRTHENQRIRKVDLAKLRFDGKQVLWIPMNDAEVYEDLTERARAK